MKESIRSSRRQLLGFGAAVGGGLVVGRERGMLEKHAGSTGHCRSALMGKGPIEKAVRWKRGT